MKNIGLITIYQVPNFGSVLQAYATQIVLEKMGMQCKIINYNYPNEWHYSKGIAKESIRSKIGHFFGILPLHRKANKLIKFKEEHFNFTRLYKNYDELRNEDWSEYDIFAVGSDQVWNSRFTLGDTAFMLSFIPDNKRRISISSSFATESIPEGLVNKYKKHLQKFNAISVRESNGMDIIEKQLQLDIAPTLVPDPTLLLSKEEWISVVPSSKFKKKKEYILLYMLTYAFEPRPYIFEIIKELQKQNDYDVIALEGYTPPQMANGIKMIDKRDSSISEFIDLFANADIVVTSSFHGTAFAVNFGIPVISVVPEGNSDDRQSSLLKSLDLDNCIAINGSNNINIEPRYDIAKTNEKICRMRKESLDWIYRSIFTK